MVQKVAFFILGLVSIVGYSQNSNGQIELSYPITLDDNFVGQNYKGIIDLGLQYRFANLKIFHIGGSLNAGYLKKSVQEPTQPADVKLFTIQPRVFAKLYLPNLTKFHPSVGLGYSIFMFKPVNEATLLNNTQYDSENSSGFNFNVALAYDLTSKVLLLLQYDFVKLATDHDIPDITYNTNINILKIGLGYKF
ncbi:outer membrane protein [Winogradskyella psychrotolerans]|uniref:outer membrane protein n=1 Tax=Winogradskyella psychrotolerans TaxID=1344585 RepID=UPI001C07A122|nr:outer membrane beta-barrel protein [Winogradskyella psychrotolerans]MBU2928958.1 porin family protein [Winogradskyella psychrotolerans]